jgi:nucleotide-binding universal stress UspA family protein
MTTSIKKILFITDLTQGSREVFNYAVSIAGAFEASITMLYVFDESPSSAGSNPAGSIISGLLGKEAHEQMRKEQEESARRVLIGKRTEMPIIRKALEKMSEDTKTNTPSTQSQIMIEDIIVTSGRVVDEILVTAKKTECDLIVMGHNDQGFLTQAMLGRRTAKQVFELAGVPVLLVPMEG